MDLISIIIPIYNKEAYLSKCIESIIKQTYSNIEIICVNDGSTDDSFNIINKYAITDQRICVIDKKNGGSTSARKEGVKRAKGKYIGFIDADDWIEMEMYERLHCVIQQYQADMVSSGYYLDGNYVTEHLDNIDEGLYDGNSIKYLRDNTIYSFNSKETGLRGSLCCKLFETNLMKEVFEDIPDKLTMAEDKMCILSFILKCKSVYVLKESYYHWVIHAESVSHKTNTDYLLKINEVYKYLHVLYKHEEFSQTMRNQAELYIVELLTLGINTRLGFQNRNLLRIDPYWLSSIPQGARVILYGGGDLGDQYRRQLKHRKDVSLVQYLGFDMPSAKQMKEFVFDCIVITIKNKGKAQQVKAQLVELGVAEEKILWFEQPEVYWKYAEAEGWLDSKEKGNEVSDTSKDNG